MGNQHSLTNFFLPKKPLEEATSEIGHLINKAQDFASLMNMTDN